MPSSCASRSGGDGAGRPAAPLSGPRRTPVVRIFTDPEGLRWTARRFESTLGAALGPVFGARPRSDANGAWLTFECVTNGWLRRLVPVPEGWEDCDEATLRGHFAAARRVRVRPKSGPLP
jgi:hypothetical protein